MKNVSKIRLISALLFSFLLAVLFFAPAAPAADSTQQSRFLIIRYSNDTGKEWTRYSYDDAEALWKQIQGGTDRTEVILNEDIELLGEKVLETENQTIVLDLNGHSITRKTKNNKQVKGGGLFHIKNKTHLIIKDSKPDSAGLNGIKGGVITGGASTSGGGAITLTEGGKCTVEGGTIYQCSTNEHGGAVMIKGKDSERTEFHMTGGTIYFCQTSGAAASCNGGAIYADNGDVYLSDCRIDSCYSEDSGGAIYLNSGKLQVSNVLFAGNHCEDYGGAIYFSGGSLLVKGSRFNTNEAKKDGGAVYVDSGGGAQFNDCVFSKNKVSGNGGAIYVNDNHTFLVDTEVTDNLAMGDGGGVFVGSSYCIGLKGLVKIKDNNSPGAFDNLALDEDASLSDGGLYEGSEIVLSSTEKNAKFAEEISKLQARFFRMEQGQLVLNDTYEREARMLASVFGDGTGIWISAGILVLVIAGVLVFGMKRKKGEKKA